jgi:hypothetical protein
MAENRTFTLIGKFDDQISKKLKEINKLFTDIRKSTEAFGSEVGGASKSINKMTSALEDAGRAAGKVRDTVSQIGEGVKGLDGIGESLEAAARAAGRAQDEVLGIGEAAGRANRQADDLMNTLLKAEGLSKFGDAMAQGLNRGMNVVMGTVQKGAGVTAKLFKDAMDDEMADIKAASGMQGSFGLAGFKGDFKDAQRMYKAYDKTVAEMIRQSSAPTAKVVELQRYTLDTMGPLMLAAQGVKKGTAMKDIDPKKIEASATQYGQFLEKAALFSQGTGSAGFRVAAGIEGLVTRGKIDTTIDFFTDNIMLMKNLEAAGFAGRGMRSSKLMNATDAQRMAAMMEAFNKSMSSESTKAMASSLTGSLQGLQDTIFNPSVGILGMSVTFSKDEQKKANESIRRIQNERIAAYTQELNSVKTSEARKKQLRINIEQAELTRDQLIKEDVISTPFKAFSYAFSNIVRKLTEALNAIGPIWTNFAVAAIEVTNKVFGPLGETLGNVASDMRAKKVTQAEGFGRIIGEIFKTIGQIMGDLANMINDPSSAMGKVQSEFMKGFMAAFKDPGTLRAAQEGIKNGLSALIGKFFEFLWKAVTFEPIRPLMLLFVAGIFGPPLIGAVIAGATPLIISAIGRMALGVLGAKGAPRAAGAGVKGLGTILAGQAALSAGAGSKLPGMAKAMSGATAIKMKGVSTLAAGMITLSTHAPKLEAAGKAVMNLGKRLPLLSIAFAGLDFAAQKAEGKSTVAAGLSAGGGLVGGLAGAAIGQALIPIPGVGAVAGGALGSFIGSWLGENIAPAIQAIPGLLSNAWKGFQVWIQNLPANLGYALGSARANMESAWKRFVQWWNNLGAEFRTTVNRLGWQFKGAWEGFKKVVSEILSGKFDWAGLASRLSSTIWNIVKSGIDGVKNLASGVANWFSGFGRGMEAGYRETKGGYKSTDTRQRQAGSSLNPLFQIRASGGLGDAISQELRMKPPGSNLVIANSSETIIPAAGGLGMKDFMNTLNSGFDRIGAVLGEITKKSEDNQKLNTRRFDVLDSGQRENKERFVKLDEKIAKLATGGAMFGSGGPGNIIGVGKSLLAMGLEVGMNPFFQYGRGFLPGGGGYIGKHAPGSYHYSGRALDVSGPPGLLDAAYAKLKTTNPAELLWRVPGHYDHLHVAYALGAGMPAFFSTQRAAMDWERKATLGNVKVSSITSNSSEGMGGAVTVNAPITIHQQPGQNSEQLAALVAMELSNAIKQARSSSMYV